MITRWTFGIRICTKTCPFPSPSVAKQTRGLHLSPAAFTAASVTTTFIAPDMSTEKSINHAARNKWDQLMDSLSRDHANPSRVWNSYLELGGIMGFENIPLQVQKQVLRKSVPRTDQLRVSAARRMKAGNRPSTPHVYETRLQTIIAHIRASGRNPEMEDYNFIMEQFAAVGHQTGARLVFQELGHVGVQPSSRTYGLCLQAIAHRLTLPCLYRFRTAMFTEAARMCIELLDDMWDRRIPLTSVNFDLIHRVFKETRDGATFEKLLRVGYGIDLAFPDRPLLELQGPGNFTTVQETFDVRTFKPLPFSTAALNTLIDHLGSTKQISRMVTAFEVFTTPLPTPISSPLAEQLSDDDEDDPAFLQITPPDGDIPPYKSPSTMPNTTTYNLLIRYAAKANHAVFARHYVVQAMERDRAVDAQLRADLSSKPLEEICSPNFAVNRGTFLPPYGFANRERHFAYLRWCYAQTTLAWKQKKQDLAFYKKWRQTNLNTLNPRPDAVNSNADHASPISIRPGSPDEPVSDSGTQSSSTPTSSVDSSPSSSRAPSMPELSEVLQIDLDAPPPPTSIRKPLDLNLHISLLTRDVEEIGSLVKRMDNAVVRLSQRVKERLGRRIWQGKDIFLMSQNTRVHLDRRDWTQRVGFLSPNRKLSQDPVSPSDTETGDWRGRQRAPHSQARYPRR